MAKAGVVVDEAIPCATSGSGDALDRLLAAVAADGDYQAVQVAPDRIQFARAFRPTWAIVAGWCTIWIVGLGALFFLVKTTETCLAVIESDHRGTRIRVSGRITSAAMGRLRSGLTGSSPAAGAAQMAPPTGSPVVPLTAGAGGQEVGQPMPTAFCVGSPGQPPQAPAPLIDLAPSASVTPERMVAPHLTPAAPPSVHQAVPTPSAPVAPSAPPAAPATTWDESAAPSTSADGLNIPEPPRAASSGGMAQRAADPNATLVPSRAVERIPMVVVDDGQRIELAACNLIGRAPVGSPTDDHPQLIALDDPSMSVSKTHLAIVHDGTGWFAEDRHSTNGVELVRADGVRQPLPAGVPLAVTAGETLWFGDRCLRFVVEGRS